MKTPLVILAVIGVILAAIFLLTPRHAPDAPMQNVFPWDIKTSNGKTSVFGITLGVTPLQTLMDTVRDEGNTAIFVDTGKQPDVETFFKTVNLGGFQARIVAVIGASKAMLEKWASHAHKMQSQASGASKIKLTGSNLEEAKKQPVIAMTYLPRVAYDETTVRQRFGEPQSIAKISDDEQYWFYPAKGLILNLNAKSREVLNYLQPEAFDKTRADILKLAEKHSTLE